MFKFKFHFIHNSLSCVHPCSPAAVRFMRNNLISDLITYLDESLFSCTQKLFLKELLITGSSDTIGAVKLGYIGSF